LETNFFLKFAPLSQFATFMIASDLHSFHVRPCRKERPPSFVKHFFLFYRPRVLFPKFFNTLARPGSPRFNSPSLLEMPKRPSAQALQSA